MHFTLHQETTLHVEVAITKPVAQIVHQAFQKRPRDVSGMKAQVINMMGPSVPIHECRDRPRPVRRSLFCLPDPSMSLIRAVSPV